MPFNVGDVVMNVLTQEIGSVQAINSARGGVVIYSVLINGRCVPTPEQRLRLHNQISDEFDLCREGFFGTHDQFKLTNTTFKVTNQSTNSIGTMMASKTDFKPYQYIPLLKFLYSNNRRLLIADEVGLGKTIEAGHIMLELKARHELRNALIICPNSLLNKWHDELLERFDIKFRVYGENQSAALLQDLKSHPESFFGIVNYEKIRNPRIQKYLEENNVVFDLVICDEAHKMRHHTTSTHQGARRFIEKSRSSIFLTATPIMNNETNLFWLLNLLDEKTYDNQYLFSNALRQNEPFVRALSKLGNVDIPLYEIIDELDNSEIVSLYTVGDRLYEQHHTIHEKFSKVPLYQRVLGQKNGEDTYEIRVRMQSDLSSLNVINGIFTRNRKKDVLYENPQAQRSARPLYIPFTDEEKNVYKKTLEEYRCRHTFIDEEGELRWEKGAMLGYITLERQLASSLYSYLENLEIAIERPDAKFDALHTVYQEVVENHENKKLIVFAVFKHTIAYLQERFKKLGITTLMISGDIDISERKEVLARFKNEDEYKILITSEVGSEGLDMQFCDALVNYDLPWNPMVVEQRIGRIDRLGQRSPVINIYNMVMQDTVHEKIYYRLLERINIFESCIGDLEAILDSNFMDGKTLQDEIDNLSHDFYTLELTDEQKEARMNSLQMALIREKTNLDEISEKFQDTLTNDVYFRNEINSMVRNYRYITSDEVHNLVNLLIINHLSDCLLQQKKKDVYTFTIPQRSTSSLTSFLTANKPLNIQHSLEYDHFINMIRGEKEIDLTFNRDYARSHNDAIYIDPFHPLILAIANYYVNNPLKYNTFRFEIPYSEFQDIKTIRKGEYFLGIYRFAITKTLYQVNQNVVTEIPLIYNVETQELLTNKEETYRIMGIAQQKAIVCDTPRTSDVQIIDDLRAQFTQRIDEFAEAALLDMDMHLQSSLQMELDRLTEYYTNRIRQQEDLVLELEQLKGFEDEESVSRYKTLPMQIQNLKNLKLDFEDSKSKVVGSVKLKESPTLISLSNIYIN